MAHGPVRLPGRIPEHLPDVCLPPELLADLHEPRLIITPDYVGRDRRRPGWRGRRTALWPGPSLRARQALAVALVTTAAVVPLTLIASPAPISPTAPTSQRSAVAAAGDRVVRSARTAGAGAARRAPSARHGVQEAVTGGIGAVAAVRAQSAGALRTARADSRQLAADRAALVVEARQALRASRLAARSARIAGEPRGPGPRGLRAIRSATPGPPPTHLVVPS
ncbi:MAG: hypothetical protein ACLQPH_11170 [Acidimicrobiales bacterium]